ncbi:MAG: ligase-associated DNA damage response endonuclease PdeM [Luteolibacter sp.]
MLLPDLAGHPIQLLPDSSLLILADKKYLVAADIHLGKSATFRAHGLPIPEGDSEKDLTRLLSLVSEHSPDHLVIAGDLFHAASGFTIDLVTRFTSFIQEIEIPFTLVKGNHDKKIKYLPSEIAQPNHLDIADIRIIHDPRDTSRDHFNICGHIHPVIRIPDGKKTCLRLPCFHLRENILTLPSFGTFTGGQPASPTRQDRFFVTHMGNVIEVPEQLLEK